MTSEKKFRAWFWTAAVLLLLFAAMRFYRLSDRPMHNDEGVNAFFTHKLLTSNTYKYDPANYHGPSLYYFQWLPSRVFGHNVLTTRLTTALVSLLFLAGFLFCRRFLGPWGAMAALLFAGFSSNVLFYSRYFIHETYVLLFTFGVFLGCLGYLEMRRPFFAALAVLSAVLLFCTKETGALHLTVMASALIGVILFNKKRWADVPPGFLRPLRAHWWWLALMALTVWVVLFTSFFKNPKGLLDSFAAYLPWLRQGLDSGHEKAWTYYLEKIILPYEPGLVAFAVIGMAATFIKNDIKGWFLSAWTFALVAAYSSIPYKTPWLAVNFILPMALLAGYGVQSVHDWLVEVKVLEVRRRIGIVSGLLVAIAISVQLPFLLKINYTESTNERHPQIYVHTSDDVFRLVDDINGIAKRIGVGQDLEVQVVSPQYWPLPFYLKEFPSAKFWGTIDIADKLDAPLVLGASLQRQEVRNALTGSYSIQTYALRPGYYLDLWINNTALEPFQRPLTVPDLLTPQRPSYKLFPGLREETFMNDTLQGIPLLVSEGKEEVRFFITSDDQKPLKPPYSVRWTGFIKIPTDGVYRFSLDSDDGSKLTLDGTELIDNDGNHSLTRKSRSANLAAGFHSLELTYHDAGGTAALDFYWKRPDLAEERVPGSVLFSGR